MPTVTNIYSNVGDTSYEAFVEMKDAGIDGVYHVSRLGEGKYTKLQPKDRYKTMENAKLAGLDLLSAVEPIGTEHTSQELADSIFMDIEFGCIQTGSMKRIAVPGTPLAKFGQINDFKLANIVAVQALAVLSMEKLPWLGIHEPSQIGFTSGANLVSAETGANPRDTETDTSVNRGFDMDACRRMLFESGFDYICRGDGSKVELTSKYIEDTRF